MLAHVLRVHVHSYCVVCLKAQRSYHQQWCRTSRQKCAETRLAIHLERNFQRNQSDDSYWLWTLPPCTLPPHRGCRPAATHQCKRQSGHSRIGYISCPSNLAAVGSTALTSDVAREENTAVIHRQFFLAYLHVLLGDNLGHGHGLQDSRFCRRNARSLVPLQRPRPGVREQACACDGPVGEKSRYTRGMFCPPKLVQALEHVSADVCLGNNVFACVGSMLCNLSSVVTVSSFVSESRI